MASEKWYEDYPEPWNRNEALAILHDAENALAFESFRNDVLKPHAPYGTCLVEYPGYKIEIIRKNASSNGSQDPLDSLPTVGLKAKWGGVHNG